MKFGITIPPEAPMREYVRWAQLAEASGFELLGVTDSQSLRRELYTTMAAVALNTQRIRFGPRVTNPITRHPAVAASALATVEEAAPGRVMATVGSGFSSTENIGEPPASLAQLREYLQTIRSLHRSGTATYRGRTLRLTWARPRVPLFLAAHGPRTLQLAGEIADGVVVGAGVLPEVVADSLEQVRIGAERAGRRLEHIDVWWFVIAYIAKDRATAVDRVRTSLAGIGHGLARFTTEGKFIPPGLVQPIQALYRAYATDEHVITGAKDETRRNAQIVDDLGLKEYLAERFAVVGTPEQCIVRLRRMRELGIRNVWLTTHFPEKTEFMERWADEVMSALGSV